MDDKHVINCNDVPEIDMTRQDGGLEHKAGVYTYQKEELPHGWRLYI